MRNAIILVVLLLGGCGGKQTSELVVDMCEKNNGSLTMSAHMGAFPGLTTTCEFGNDWSKSE